MATSLDQNLAPGRAGRFGRPRDRVSVVALAASLIPFALAFAVYLAVFLEMRPGSTGDEPHYLVTAESIAYDFDLDLKNDYASRERVLRVVNVFPLGPHGAVFKDSGELRPFRAIGLPLLVAPGVRLGGLTGARLIMVLIAALLADQLYRLLRDLRIRSPYRIAAWAAVVFCMPILAFTSQFYPELPGALLVVVSLRVMARWRASPAAVAVASAAAAALPWLHMRYLPLSLGIFAGLALAACRGSRATTGKAESRIAQLRAAVAECAAAAIRRWRTVILPLLLPYAFGLGLLAVCFHYWYGSLNPQTGYDRFYGNASVGAGGWDFWYEFVLRDIFDPVAGWIPFAPVHWLGLAALGCLVVWFGWPAAACVAAAVGYELFVASVGPNVGWGLPGRYPMIVIPLIAVPLAVAIQALRPARFVFVPLLAGSFVFAVAAVRDYELLYPIDGTQHIVGLRSIAPAFPQTSEPQPPESFSLVPNGPPPPQTGRVEGGEIVARAGRDRPGFVRYGPYASLKAGAYEARFALAATGVKPEQQVAVAEVVGAGESIFARETLVGSQLRAGRPADVDLSFATPGGSAIETRVYYLGRGTLRVGRVDVQPIAVPQGKAHLRDWPLAFLWVAGTALVGWLFVELLRLTRQRRAAADRTEGSGSGA